MKILYQCEYEPCNMQSHKYELMEEHEKVCLLDRNKKACPTCAHITVVLNDNDKRYCIKKRKYFGKLENDMNCDKWERGR